MEDSDDERWRALKGRAMARSSGTPQKSKRIWWSNTIFFTAFHLFALYGWYYPPSSWRTWLLCYLNWQIGTLGITIGTSRCRKRLMQQDIIDYGVTEASLPKSLSELSWESWEPSASKEALGSKSFEGLSLTLGRWWVLRHRLHHRFTDTESDPYSANKGLFYSHVGWIFVKEEYPKLKLIDKHDLDNDSVVRFQHCYFVPLAVVGGLVLPAVIGQFWFGSWIEGLLWGGIIARIAIWHCTCFTRRSEACI